MVMGRRAAGAAAAGGGGNGRGTNPHTHTQAGKHTERNGTTAGTPPHRTTQHNTAAVGRTRVAEVVVHSGPVVVVDVDGGRGGGGGGAVGGGGGGGGGRTHRCGRQHTHKDRRHQGPDTGQDSTLT